MDPARKYVFLCSFFSRGRFRKRHRSKPMSLRSAYDAWHQRIFDAAPQHEDASSPWYLLVREYIGDVAGLRILEVACGRGGFVRQLAKPGACVPGCDFSSPALHAAHT